MSATIASTRELLTSNLSNQTISNLLGWRIYVTLSDLQNKKIVQAIAKLMVDKSENLYLSIYADDTDIYSDNLQFDDTQKVLYILDSWHYQEGVSLTLYVFSNNDNPTTYIRMSYSSGINEPYINAYIFPKKLQRLQSEIMSLFLTL